MALLTLSEYQTLTGDTTLGQPEFDARLVEAVGMLADRLGRAALEDGTWTEPLLVDRAGRAHPTVLPLVATTAGTIVGDTIAGAGSAGELVDVTYDGGWTAPGVDVTGRTTVPSSVRADLAAAILTLSTPTSGTPAGAASVKVGDVAITYGADGAPVTAGADGVRWSAATLRYRHRRVIGV